MRPSSIHPRWIEFPLTIPMLVLIGGHDLETTQDAARRVVAGAPNAQQVDWADVAHLPSMEKPEHFLALLSDWVASPSATTSPVPATS